MSPKAHPSTPEPTAPTRQTPQREAILRVLANADRPLSPGEIHRKAAARRPGLGIATVYRTIRGMLDAGQLASVDLPGSPSRYELAGKTHHHHFHCRRCDRVYEVDDCPGSLRDLAPDGFRVEDHEVVLYGVCRACARSADGDRIEGRSR